MHPRTTATLERLANVEWFTAVGVKDTDAAIVLSSWDEAIEHCSSATWEDLLSEASNQYCERLAERDRARFSMWNEVVGELKRVTVPFVRQKIARVVPEHRLDTVFEDTVQWDILSVCLEAEYADVYPPGFCASQAYWYVSGHFPCGWKGAFPEGTLIIF